MVTARRRGIDLDDAFGSRRDRPPFAEFALTLFALVHRLHRSLAEQDSRRVLFCAREGQLLAELFDRHAAAFGGSDAQSRYFLASRRSTLLASLGPIAHEDFAILRRDFPELTNAGALHSLALNHLASTTELDLDAPFDPETFRVDPLVATRFDAEQASQRELLQQYVSDLADGARRVEMVDVGWRGSTQDHLIRALGPEIDVRGHYMGLVASRPIAHLDAKTAHVFGPTEEARNHYRVLKHFKAIWEYVLAADHGSVERYESDGHGGVTPLLDPHRVELADFTNVVGPVQDGLRAVFERLCSMPELGEIDDHELQEAVARHHSRMLFYPTTTELEIAQARGHYANFGNPWVKEVPEGLRLSRRERLSNLVGVARAPRSVFQGFPPLALHRLGLDPLIPMIGTYRHVREFVLTKERPRSTNRAT